MKKFLSFAIATAFLMSVPGMALAKEKGGKHKGEVSGKVTAVDATTKTITIEHGKKHHSKTFNATDATTITVNGASGTLADITVGMHAEITKGSTPGTAASIKAGGEKKKRRK